MSALTTAIVALVVVLVVLGAAYWVYRDRKAGKNSCGCNMSTCGGCSGCSPPLTEISDGETSGSPADPEGSKGPEDPDGKKP